METEYGRDIETLSAERDRNRSSQPKLFRVIVLLVSKNSMRGGNNLSSQALRSPIWASYESIFKKRRAD